MTAIDTSQEDRTGTNPLLRIRTATKRFGAVVALNQVSLELRKGEILAVLGDNGAGKSTLMKCISGWHRLDSGVIELDGQEVGLRNPHDARGHGIETVYQDLALFDNLDIASNFFAGRELTSSRLCGWLNKREMRRSARAVLERLEVSIPDLASPVGLLSGGQRQAIAVVRAVTFASRIVILDEPTAALGVRETRNVLKLVKRLPEQGIGVILVSHSLDQVAEVADRAIVMRRGATIGEADPDRSNHDRIVSMIVGSPSATRGADPSTLTST
jgi:D-xylose transport system ATP-binding protein